MTFDPERAADAAAFFSHLATIGDIVAEGMIGYTVDGTAVVINAAARALLGLPDELSAAECAARFMRRACDPAGEPWPPEQLPQQRLARGETFDALQMRYRDPANRDRLLRLNGRVLRDRRGRPQVCLLVFDAVVTEDVGSREPYAELQSRFDATVQKLSRQAAQFDAVVSSIPVGVALVDSEERSVQINQAGQRILGSPPMLRLEDSVDHYNIRNSDGTPVTPDELPLALALQGEQVTDREHILRGVDGAETRISTSASPIIGQDGSIIGAVAIFRDVTQRRREEEERAQRVLELEGLRDIAQATAIARQEPAMYGALVARLARLLRIESCALLIWDAQRNIFQAQAPIYGIRASRLATLSLPFALYERLIEQSDPDQPLVLDSRDCAPGSVQAEVLQLAGVRNAILARLGLRERLIGLIMACDRLDEQPFTEREARLLQTVAPQAALAIENSRLYTQMRSTMAALQAQARNLARANDELDAFTYSVSHDLRAPLRAIDGFTRLLERSLPDISERARHQLTRIRVNVDKMSSLIDALLAFSRAGRQVPEWNVVDTTALVREALRLHDQALANCGARVTVADLPSVVGDSRLLELVFANLIDNAIKYRRPHEPLQLHISGSWDEAKEVVTLVVRDNGIGFDMRYHDKIFQVFQRLHTHETPEGTGIGLALVRKIVERHNGRIWAEGTPGVGATFYIELPAPGVSEGGYA